MMMRLCLLILTIGPLLCCASTSNIIYDTCRIENNLCIELCDTSCQGAYPCSCLDNCDKAATACDQNMSSQAE